MKHYLTFKDEKSDKFWQIELAEKSFTVTYGKTGTAGTSQVKTFSSVDQCNKEAEKLLNEKLKKGYQQGEGQKDYLEVWNELVNATDRTESLVKHFSSTGTTNKVGKKLRSFCEAVTNVSISDKNLCLVLPWDYNGEPVTLMLSPPYSGKFDKSVPNSFKQFLKIHNGVGFRHHDEKYESMLIEGVDDEGRLIEDGGWDPSAVEEGDNEDVINYLEARDKDVDEIICFGSYDMRQNWYVLHPKKKNSAGEFAIVLFDHGGCDMSETTDLTFGDFLISQLAGFILGLHADEEEDVGARKDLVSVDFHKFLREQTKSLDEYTAKNLLALNWDKQANTIYQSILGYWNRIAEEEKKAIGIFDIRWEDGTNGGIEFDYEENNAIESAMEDGCIRNELVIDLEEVLTDELGFDESTRDEKQFETVKNILCTLSQELIVKSTKSDVFASIKKKNPHYIQFAYWHDEDANVIFDSKGELATSIYKKKDDVEAEVNRLFDTFHLIPEMFPEDCMILYNKLNAFLKAGDYESAKIIVAAFMENFRELENAQQVFLNVIMKGATSGNKMNFLEHFTSDVLVLGILSKDDSILDSAHELVPPTITDPVLAFNLACNASLKGNKNDLLKFTKQAIGLGKPKSEFMMESDFDHFKNDPEFLAALKS